MTGRRADRRGARYRRGTARPRREAREAAPGAERRTGRTRRPSHPLGRRRPRPVHSSAGKPVRWAGRRSGDRGRSPQGTRQTQERLIPRCTTISSPGPRRGSPRTPTRTPVPNSPR
ncbi:hypothetical protein SGPA1_12272 [Streptomyces misionensis JCM 4497]